MKRFLCLAFGILMVWSWAIAPPAWAEAWTLVVTSEDGVQQQYVDVESIQRSRQGVTLKTYWTDAHNPDDLTYAITEYDCDRQLFRDIELNGKPHQTAWYELGEDKLNRAVMDYSCPLIQSK